MCRHRPAGKWAKRWARFSLIVLSAFFAMEGYGLATEGYPATLSAFIHCLGGQRERCRHVHLSRVLIVAFFGWAIAHLGWGVLGWTPRRHHSACSTHR